MIIRIIENLLILYYMAYFVIDWLFFAVFAWQVKREKHQLATDAQFTEHPVSIIVPAYNEEVSIVDSVKMLLAIDYPCFEVIVVNDGSNDKTLFTLLDAYPEATECTIDESRWAIDTKAVKSCWKWGNNCIIVDKENGGKADAVNVGINFARYSYVCTIDADSVLDKDALKQTVQPMMDDDRVFVSGGQLAVANGVTLQENRVVSSSLPRNAWVQWQIVEYLKSFMIARYSMSKLNAVMIMSGAFSLYRRDDLLQVGGFLTAHNNSDFVQQLGVGGSQTVCEDMEIVVRMWRWFAQQNIPARATFLPHPLCWTEVPDAPDFLLRQRNRWHRGLAETLKIHRSMLFDPTYGSIGLFAFPYYLFFELLAPVIKVGTLGFLIVAGCMGYFNHMWVLLSLLFATFASALITCMATIAVEQWSTSRKLVSRDALRYKTVKDWLQLILMSILGDVVYAPVRIYAQLRGLIDFLKKKNEWYKFSRKGFSAREEQ
jgi:cellulose synthase/poly-beta-1,6-N-acetylglucosamine synthase-like glycosyltransferase